MFQFFAHLYLVAAAVLAIFQADDNAKDVFSAFKSADTFLPDSTGRTATSLR